MLKLFGTLTTGKTLFALALVFLQRIARPNRAVTFVTDQELQFLTQTAVEEDRSMASVLRRIIAARIKNN
jgi:hypothetical protein